MKAYNATGRRSAQLKAAIETTLLHHETYRDSYFWTDNGNASERARKVRRFNENNPPYDIRTGDTVIKVRPHLSMSRKNTYYRLVVKVGDQFKDVRVLKRLMK